MNDHRFDNQVAIVTGGAAGLGKSIADRLAAEGARVFLFDRNQDVLAATQKEFLQDGLKVQIEPVDISSESSVTKGIEAVIAQAQRIDVMVNCAGIVGPTNTKIADYPADALDQVYAVNLRGAFLMTKHTLAQMQKLNYGRILLIASIAGKEGNPGMCGYSASKAGVIGLVKAVGKEYSETGITVNGLAPAVIQTAMIDACDPEQVKYMTDRIPMKRCGTLEEVAAIACWIVSKEASFNTAFTFDLTGGRATY